MIKPIETRSTVLRYTDLEKQIWREINTFSDIRLIKEMLKKDAKAQNAPLTDEFAMQKARDIQYCIKQAKEYFYASKSATLVIKPTLIYYGLVSLVAALIITKNRDKSLHSMKEGHGIKDLYPSSLNTVGTETISRNDILKISSQIQDSGTFVELMKMTLSEYFILPIKHEKIPDTSKDFKQELHFKNSYPDLREIPLIVLLQNIPEVWKETKTTLKKETMLYAGEAVASNGTITCRISKELVKLDELQRNLSFTEGADFGESNNYFFFSMPLERYMSKAPLTKTDVNATQYFNSDKNNSLIASDFIAYYLTFFLLGSLARYKPALWRYALEDPMHGLSTIPEILCDSAYIKMPLYFLNEFTNNFYKI